VKTHRKITYPFVPRSRAYLQPGQFWSLPLSGHRFACGRILQLHPGKGTKESRRFLAALLDWCGTLPPTAHAIAGCGAISQGLMHLASIGETHSEILGWRDLDLDGLRPGWFLDQAPGPYTNLLCGLYRRRRADPEEMLDTPVLPEWGTGVINALAETAFAGPRP
jgi:hypothetical protein